MTKIPEKFRNYFWGENKLFFPDEEFVFKMDFPRVFVRYNVGEAYFASFEEFVESIAEIQFLDGERPSNPEIEQIMTDIWNYIALEERRLEDDLANIDIEEWEDEDYD